MAVHRRDGGLAQTEQPHPALAREMELAPRPNGRATVRTPLHLVDGTVGVPQVGELVQVIASAEMVTIGLDQQDTCVVVDIKVIHHQIEFVTQLARQGVALVRAVQRDSGDTVLLFVDERFELHVFFPEGR